jgi:ribose 5-phosphate isomerase B
LGGRITGEPHALAIVDAFLGAEFEGGRHARRLALIADIEKEECAQDE